jgi:tetratricopeptide (TPR) repeat protein/tRNA A-37 threonylcarbamoyl transferase component Bud32
MARSDPPLPESVSEPEAETGPDLLLDDLWELGQQPNVRSFLAEWPELGMDDLLAVLRVDQRRRRLSGQPAEIAGYIREFPSLGNDAEAVFELVYNELLIREEMGERPDPREYSKAFPELADRLRVQLEVHDALSSGELDQFAVRPGQGASSPISPSVPGYEVVGEIGRGGMGVVYRARQLKPNRLVALKMILDARFASEQDLIRFQNEAEVIAALEHPNIVPILEVGQHEGLHYFSMPLLTGGSLAASQPRPTDDPRAAARLIAEVAAAVHHAHERGILHRDLKPANILLDTEGRPHVSDFGLAKRILDRRSLTESGAIMGSPGYMSPEQASGKPTSVTTASDIYGLGAILYSLLTGHAPFEGSSVHETIARLQDAPPEAPSKVNPAVPRPLEQICMMCLEKEPARRYPTAKALAADLQRWLAGEPVLARPEPFSARTRRWMRRRRTAVTASCVAMLMALGGLVMVLTVQARANRVLRAANERERSRFDLAMEAIRTFHTGVSEELLLKEPQFQGLRTKLLHGAQEFFSKLETQLQAQTDPRSRRAMVQAYDELAALTDKIGSKTEALNLYRRELNLWRELARDVQLDVTDQAGVARCLLALGYSQYQTGQADEAVVAFRQARSLLNTLNLPTEPSRDFRSELASCNRRIGDALAAIGFSERALLSYKAGRSLCEALVWEHPAVSDYRSSLAEVDLAVGDLHWKTGQAAEAVASFQSAREVFETLAGEHPAESEFRRGLARCYNAISYPLHAMGRSEEALEALEAARKIFQTLAGENPAITEFKQQLAFSDAQIGTLLLDTGRSAEALVPYERARSALEPLFEANPAVDEIANDLARAHSQIGQVLGTMGKQSEALTSLKKARALREALAGENHVLVAAYRSDLAVTLGNIGALERAAGRLVEATTNYRKAITILDNLRSRTPDDYYNLACYHSVLVGMALRPGSGVTHDEAAAEFNQAMENLRQAAANGFRMLSLMSLDHDLDPLRSKAEFQLLMMDLSFPNDPLAPL